MRPIDQRNFVLLWLQESGDTTAEIAAKVGLAIRSVQEAIQRAKDLRQHLKNKEKLFDDPNWVRILLKGVSVCIHGLPTLDDGTWVCAFCTATNNPAHPAFRREKRKNRESEGETVAKDVQKTGPAKFRPKLRKKKSAR